MRKSVLLLATALLIGSFGGSAFAQEARQRRPPDSSRGQAIPRPPQEQRPPPQRHYDNPRRGYERHSYRYNRPYNRYNYGYYNYGYNYGYYPRYYYQRCAPDRWVFIGYDWYGYPLYDLIRGYCY